MQASQNIASAHKAQAVSANCSNRAAVYEIFQTTGALLGSFRNEFRAATRARHKETRKYLKNLHQSVREMLAEMRQNRENATNSTREQLRGFADELRETVTGGLHEISHLRQEAAHELSQMRAEDHDALCRNERQELEELADTRRENTRTLHSELSNFKADLEDAVSQERKHFREELGLAEPPRMKKKTKRARTNLPQIREEGPQKKSAAEKIMPRRAKTRPAAAATKALHANTTRQAGARKTAKTMASPRLRKRQLH